MNNDYTVKTAIERANEDEKDLATTIDDYIEWIQISRGGQLKFMISLWGLPWWKFMKNSGRRQAELPYHPVMEVSKGQPWDVGHSDIAIAPTSVDIYRVLKQWLESVYAEGVAQHGSSRLPSLHNVTRAGGVMLSMGYTWWDRDKADPDEVLEVLSDTKVARVLWNYLQRDKLKVWPHPPWEKMQAIYNLYEYSGQRADAVEALLFKPDERKKPRKSLAEKMKEDAVGGKGGYIHVDPKTKTLTWAVEDEERFGEIINDMGLAGYDADDVSIEMDLLHGIGNAIKEEDYPTAVDDTTALKKELETHL